MQAPMAIRQITVSGSCSTALKRSTLLFCDFDAVCRLASAGGELAPDHHQHRRPRAGDRSLARHLGVVLNVVCGVSRISMEEVIKGVWPFMIAQLVVLFLMVLFPGLVMIPAKWFGG